MNQNRSPTFCINPYINLSVHPKGVIKPCCMSQKEFITDNGKQFLNEESVMDFWRGQDRLRMIENLNQGKKISECISCWKEEEAGIKSKRLRDNETYKNKIVDETTLPIVADFSLGNLCNLRCRICQPIHSSQWMVEEAMSSKLGKTSYLNQKTWSIIKESFDSTNDLFWKNILELLPDVEKFDFAGGEPFYIEKHWDIIRKCVEEGWSKKQHIHYNTNGTIFPEKYIELLDEFKIVDIQISTDGVGKKFEYLRDLSDWDVVEENIEKFLAVSKKSKADWRFSMCLSVSAFNVFDFYETYEHYSSKGIGIYVNIVHDGSSMSVLPEVVKNKVIDHLNSFKNYSNERWIIEKETICNYMKNSSYDRSKWEYFKSRVEEIDQKRNQSFSKTFPEYFEILKGSF